METHCHHPVLEESADSTQPPVRNGRTPIRETRTVQDDDRGEESDSVEEGEIVEDGESVSEGESVEEGEIVEARETVTAVS